MKAKLKRSKLIKAGLKHEKKYAGRPRTQTFADTVCGTCEIDYECKASLQSHQKVYKGTCTDLKQSEFWFNKNLKCLVEGCNRPFRSRKPLTNHVKEKHFHEPEKIVMSGMPFRKISNNRGWKTLYETYERLGFMYKLVH